MEGWIPDSEYSFGEVVSCKGRFFFCISKRTNSYPSDLADWLAIDAISLGELPKSAKEGFVILNPDSLKCYIFTSCWEEVSKRSCQKIIFSNRNPRVGDSGKLWVNEAEELIFKFLDGWQLLTNDDQDIFDFPFSPSRFDDEFDSSGNGTFYEGCFWIDSKNNRIYENLSSTFKSSVWQKI
jgi:hypothetical protein